MLRSTSIIWISTALLIGVVQGVVPAEALAQPPVLTREVDSPIRGDRYLQQVTVTFVLNDFVGNRTVTPDIPEGKTLFLQSVSMHTVLTHGQNLMQAVLGIAVQPTDPVPLALFYVDMDFQAAELTGSVPRRERRFTGNRDINMVVNAGETIRLGFFRSSDEGLARENFSVVTLIGYFVDAEPEP